MLDKHAIYLVFFGLLIIVPTYFCAAQTPKTKTYKQLYKKGSFIYKIETFDSSGNLLSSTECHDATCSLKDVDIHIYNEKKQLIEDSIYTNKYGYHQLIWRIKYSYYPDGLLKTETKINDRCPEGFDESLTYYYNNRGNVSHIQKNHACRDIHYGNYPIHFEYNDNGNKISKTALTSADSSKPFYKYIYRYDEKGNLTESNYYFREKDSLRFSSADKYEYDSLNQKVLESWVTVNYITSVKYTYYNNGLLKEEIPPRENIYPYEIWYQYYYDLNGNLTKKQLFYMDKKGRTKEGRTEIIEYEFH